MTYFSPFDRKAWYEALSRNAWVMAQACADSAMRGLLLDVAEHWAVLARLRSCGSMTGLGDSPKNKKALHEHYAAEWEEIARSSDACETGDIIRRPERSAQSPRPA